MKKSIAIIACLVFCLSGCDKDNQPTDGNLKITIQGLADLGSAARYEGWLIIGGQPVSTGTFSVDANGMPDKSTFKVAEPGLANATAFVLTIEPFPDNNPLASNMHLVAGDFVNNGNTATVTVSHAAALGNNFTSSSGKFILATPTNGPATNEVSGIWFLSLASGSPAKGLTLPALPAGWKYEGWVVINSQPVTSGRFTNVALADESAMFSGPLMGPPFPGEDYLVNAPAGLTFPADLRGGTAVISIEPDPDNSPAPFLLKPLTGSIPANAMDHTDLMMQQNLGSFPTGTVEKTR